MSQPHITIFSLEQARETLPLIRPIVDDAMACQEEINEQLQEQFQATESRVEEQKLQNPPATDRHIRSTRQNLTDYVNELFQIGAQLHDFNLGRVDFPSRLQDRLIYLCWETGEEDIKHWHELHESCQERRVIDDQNFTANTSPADTRE